MIQRLFIPLLFLLLPLPLVAASTDPYTSASNLARGKKAIYSRLPDRLANRGNEATKLTNGKLAEVGGDELWKGYQRDVAAWSSANLGLSVLIDLGEVRSVERIVTRFSGGKPGAGIAFPSEIVFIASEDGTTYHELGRLNKVTEGERSLASEDPGRFFFLHEDAHETRWETFDYPVERKARFIGFTLKSAGSVLALDEIALLAASAPMAVLDGLPEVPAHLSGVALQPKTPEMVITTNVPTPNWVYVIGAGEEKPLRYFFDLPVQVRLAGGKELTVGEDASKATETTRRWVVAGPLSRKAGANLLGPLFLGLEKEAHLPGDAALSMQADAPDARATRIALRAVEIPRVPKFQHLHISLGWVREQWMDEHPDFIGFCAHTGFNYFPVFPFYALHNGQGDRLERRIAEARKAGQKILVIDSPIHRLWMKHSGQDEVRNQVNGRAGKRICPSYTGRFYQEEIKRIAEWARWVRPDAVFHDIEIFRSWTTEEARDCSRCQAAFAASGLADWNRFLLAQGTRLARDLHAATTVGSEPPPSAGIYDVKAVPPVYDIFDFDAIYPRFIRYVQPHLYYAGDMERIYGVVTRNTAKTGKGVLLPWLTGGTFGEYPAEKLGATVLLCLLNGAAGITYYRYDDMDPMDYYHHALALAYVAPYEMLLVNGERIEEAGVDHPRILCSAFGTREEALVFLGNYTTGQLQKTRLAFGDRKVAGVRDLVTGKELPLKEAGQFEVAAEGYRLLHVRFE